MLFRSEVETEITEFSKEPVIDLSKVETVTAREEEDWELAEKN